MCEGKTWRTAEDLEEKVPRQSRVTIILIS